jgi:surface antigen
MVLGSRFMGKIFIMSASLLLSSCGNSTALKTIGTLAGSSAGSAIGQAINAAGPWGYVAGIATTAAGGMAGNLVTRLFLPNTEKAVKESLISALDTPQTGKAIIWGTAKKPEMGIVATTGDVFASAIGLQCRPFRITIGMPAPVVAPAAEAAPTALDQVGAATSKLETGAKVADKVGSIGGEATAGISDAAGTVGDAAGKAKQATAIMGDMGLMGGGKPKIKESYGTACKDAKGAWVTAKT